MPTVRINIETTHAAIQIQSTPANLKITSPEPQLNLRTEQTQLRMRSTLPKVEIDQQQAFAETGNMSPLVNARDFYKSALHNGVRAIGTIVNEGLQFLRVEQNRNPVASQAKINRGINRPKTINVRAAPASGPDIGVRSGQVDIRIQPGQVAGRFSLQRPKMDYMPGKVSVQLVPPPSIVITVDEVASSFVPQPVGGGQAVNAQL